MRRYPITIQKRLIRGLFGLVLFSSSLISGGIAWSADDIRINAAENTLAVSGDCTGTEALVLIYYAGTDHIWGSSNPPCIDRRYAFKQDLSEWHIAVKDLELKVIDGGYDTYEKIKYTQEKEQRYRVDVSDILGKKSEATAESAAALDAASSTTDRSDAANMPSAADAGSGRLLDSLVDAVKHVMTLIADTIKTTLLTTIKLFVQAIRVEYGGDITVPEGDNQIAGSGRIEAGTREEFVSNTQVTDSVKIIVTPLAGTDAPLIVSEKIPGQGFRIALPRAAMQDVPFDWLIIKTYGKNPSNDALPANKNILPTPPPAASSSSTDTEQPQAKNSDQEDPAKPAELETRASSTIFSN